jgi:hypothetical protein
MVLPQVPALGSKIARQGRIGEQIRTTTMLPTRPCLGRSLDLHGSLI